MSWINSILGNGSENESENESDLNDKDYALELLKNSKEDVYMLCKCTTEASNPELRKIFTNQLNSSINDFFKLSDLANQKGFYNALATPSSQIKQDMQEVQNLQKAQNTQEQNTQ